MKFSESWLREWVNPELSTQQLVDKITMAGLEVDAVEPVAGSFSGVFVGEILTAEQHPDADKLRVCTVAGPDAEPVQVVCGAPNARPGIKVPFATVGAKLPGDFKIKKAKLRGVESFGMLCAQTELKAGDDDDGLWELPLDAPVGVDLREYLSLDDAIIEVDLTPNRSDCLGIKGLAREVSALTGAELKPCDCGEVNATIDDRLNVALTAVEQCSRYVGRVIKGVDISRPSPLWMQEKLRRSGIRSIDAVVDVTNYVLLELGQPMHAFDLAKLSGGINVRLAQADEAITLLDGQEIKLNDNTLVIADDSGAIAMAGVMGGASTAVDASTQDLFLESAFFHPTAIAGRARSYGLHTDSSHRFERGVDYNSAQQAIERATQLLLDIVGGQAAPVVSVDSEALPKALTVVLRRERIAAGLGFAIEDAEVERILQSLGLGLKSRSEDGWVFDVPSYRFDISIEADLLEELARIYGYNRLPTTTPSIPVPLPQKSERRLALESVEHQLTARGYREVITYSFIDPQLHKMFDAETEAVSLLNPISADMSVMRTSLLPGLVQTLAYNLKRQKQRACLFEKGMRFIPKASGLDQSQGLAGLIYGAREANSWNNASGDVDFYDLKGDLQSLLSLTGKEYRFVPTKRAALHPGQTASIVLDDKEVGVIGALHPQVLQDLGLSKPAYVFEIDLWVLGGAEVPTYTPISKFPEVSRDLAVVVDRQTAVADMSEVIKGVAGEHLKDLSVFDIYSGEGIDPQRKSVAFNLTFQHSSRTLNEEEINNATALVVKRLEEKFDAKLRQ
ncbi:MAG: phenylalanine--tRNA ligase subunit beta [Alteromonadaceae bacterium]|nr:MAG: phenylalanine--tRNA ligase subunit beta [Alteromonadaceae bacterium]